jgi:predicted O-linked N-acetylglucosamine transferase (SPINDLY family)
VFCSFSHDYKITPPVFDVWMRLLAQVPGSVLWLVSRGEATQRNLRKEAALRGIAPERLVFAGRVPRVEDHLARYRQADMFLDTHPYNAHTTASDALWAGCPVLTCPGTTFASRVAGSLNHHLGMHDFNVADDAAFVATAVRLGNDPAALQAARATLAQRREDSGLFDMADFARDFSAVVEALARERGWQGPHIA